MRIFASVPNGSRSRQLLLLLVFVSPIAGATLWVQQPAEHYYSSAEVVARVRVTRAELIFGTYQEKSVECGERVEAEVVDIFKGDAKKVTFVIDGMLLAVGNEYLVFVERRTNRAESPIISDGANTIGREALSRLACAQFHQEDVVSWLSTSRFIRHWSKAKNDVEEWITPAYNISVPDDSGALFQRVRLRALKVNGKVVESDYWSWSDDAIFPDEFWTFNGAYEWASYRKYLVKSFEKAGPGEAKTRHLDSADSTEGQ